MAIKNAPRVFITVDGEEKLLTNALMMEFAISALREIDAPAEVVEKAIAHYAALTKKSDTPKAESKVAKDNKVLASKVYKVMPVGEPVTTSWVMQHVHDIMTVSKCSQIMAILIKDEVVTKGKDGRHVTYTRQ